MRMTASEVQRRMKRLDPTEQRVKNIIVSYMDRYFDAWLTVNRAALRHLEVSADGRLDHI